MAFKTNTILFRAQWLKYNNSYCKTRLFITLSRIFIGFMIWTLGIYVSFQCKELIPENMIKFGMVSSLCCGIVIMAICGKEWKNHFIRSIHVSQEEMNNALQDLIKEKHEEEAECD
jgi:hypothetical protein